MTAADTAIASAERVESPWERQARERREAEAAERAARADRAARHPNPTAPFREAEAALALAERLADESGVTRYVWSDRDKDGVRYEVSTRNGLWGGYGGGRTRDMALLHTVEPLRVEAPALAPCPVCGGKAKPQSQHGGYNSLTDDMDMGYDVCFVACTGCGAKTEALANERKWGDGVRNADARAALAWNRGEVQSDREIVMPPSTLEVVRDLRGRGLLGQGKRIVFEAKAAVRDDLVHHFGPLLDAEGKPTRVGAWLVDGAHKHRVRLTEFDGRTEPVCITFEVLFSGRIGPSSKEADRGWKRKHGRPKAAK